MIDQAEKDLILLLASSSASLDHSPKHNWVENSGGLPPYVRKLARGIMKSGHDLSSAISIAISRIKVWAAGGSNVNADTRAKAVKALAQWEATKAKNAMKLTYEEEGVEYILLSNISSFNTEIVRTAWDAIQREKRAQWNQDHPTGNSNAVYDSSYPYCWLKELGTDYIIVTEESTDGTDTFKIPYTVNDNYEVDFGDPIHIVQLWVEDGEALTADELAALSNIPNAKSATANIVKLSQSLKK